MNPAPGFEGRVIALGFRVIEIVMLKSLGLNVVRLSTPHNMNVADAITLLSRKFPDTTFDKNTNFTAF